MHDLALEALLADVIATAAHPDIATVTTATDAAAWCRVRVDFGDGSTVYIGIGG